MRKSKYLVLSPLYFEFIGIFRSNAKSLNIVKNGFNNQNILDLLRFDNLGYISKDLFKDNCINFIYFPDTIKSDVLHEFNNCQTKYINFSNCKLLDCIELEFFKKTNLKIVDLSMCDQLISIDDSSFSLNNIHILKLPPNIQFIGKYAFADNEIKLIDLLNCNKIRIIEEDAFIINPLKEIKICDGLLIDYDDHIYKNNIWNEFVKYYNESGRRAGDYKYEDYQWKWYPL